jgi:predicted GNAT family acetyltransferase
MAQTGVPNDEKLDETLEETFPASDAPANTVETGILTGHEFPAEADVNVVDNPGANRLEITVEGQTAFLAYVRTQDSFTLIHTEVPVSLRGRHFGDALVRAGLRLGRSQGLRIVVQCPFAKAYMRKHPGL